MDLGVSNRVVARNRFGQFARDCQRAGERTVERAIERGAALSRDFAPTGSKPDLRTIPLKQSIEAEMLSANSGHWTASARHALAIEKGARRHDLPGNVRFFWAEEGRMWEPGDNTIDHPGNAPQPYLRPAYEIVMAQIMQIAREEYPG